MIKKIKDYFIKIYNDYKCLYIPYFKVFINNIIIFLIALFCGVLLGRLTNLNNESNNTISLSADSDIIIENKEYFMIPVLPYVNSNTGFDVSQGNFIISYNTEHNGFIDIIYPSTMNNNLSYEQKYINTGYTLDIAMQSHTLGYYNEYYIKTYRISLNINDANWLNNYDTISRYGYFYDIGTGLNYNTVYNFYSGDNIIAKLYFLDTTIIPYFEYNDITNLVFTTDKVSSFNLNDLVDMSFDRGFRSGYEEGERVGYDAGYTTGYNEGHAIGYDKGVLGDNVFTILADGINNFFSINILPNFSILNLLSIVVGAIIILGIGMKVFSI